MASIIKVDTIQDQDGNNIISEAANTITIGASGDTITIPSGATFASVGIDDNATSTAITIDSSERVGIGTSSPQGNLSVEGQGRIVTIGDSGTVNVPEIRSRNSTDTGNTFLRISSYSTQFYTEGSEVMRIDSSGNVGIGTSSPNAILDIKKNDTNTSIGSSTSVLKINNGSGTLNATSALEFFHGTSTISNTARLAGVYGVYSSYNASGLGGSLVFATNTAGDSTIEERMRIDSSGNVGIGTSSPNRQLTVQSTTNAEFSLTAGNSSKSQIFFADTDDTNIGRIEYEHTNNAAVFWTNDAERMRIDSSGNVGISTTSTSSANLVIATNSNSGSGIRLIGKSANGGAEIDYYNNANNTLNGFLEISDTQGTLSAVTNIPFTFRTNNTERMRIQSSGTISFLTTASSVAQGDVGICIMSDGELLTARDVGGGSTVTKFNGFAGRFQTMGDGDAENTNNSYGAISDRTLKENEVDANSQWNDIKSLQIKNYNFIEYPDRTQLGVIAQDLETSGMNGLVKTNDEGIKSVKYSVLYMKAVKALQEAMERIETLEAKVQTLENNQP